MTKYTKYKKYNKKNQYPKYQECVRNFTKKFKNNNSKSFILVPYGTNIKFYNHNNNKGSVAWKNIERINRVKSILKS